MQVRTGWKGSDLPVLLLKGIGVFLTVPSELRSRLDVQLVHGCV